MTTTVWSTLVVLSECASNTGALLRLLSSMPSIDSGRLGLRKVQENGVAVNCTMFDEILHRQGLRGKASGEFKVTKEGNYKLAVHENVRNQDFSAAGNDQR